MTILEQIAGSRRLRVEQSKRRAPLEALREISWPTAMDFRSRLESLQPDRRAVIAEVKRRSPSKGLLRPDLDPADLARSYQEAGALAISVLTEPDHFGGSLEDLEAVRQAASIPVLYKDFVVDPYQVWEARAAGADLVLLIVALLGQRVAEFVRLARESGLEPLVEVHGPGELDLALAAGARVVGINNRDLKTFRVDLDVTRELLRRVPPGVYVVSESGLREPADLDELSRAGAHAFLIGESLVIAPDPGAALRRFVEVQR